ncbi:MAG: zf-HC2 domain-containing protein [candidate division Zixibacteria bacterium]|nr:zf-HC2 domain-containing protein [candidate division Zixibacteria bacterium]
MNCEEFKDTIIVHIYGKLPADKEKALQKHVQECSGCARVYKKMQKFHGMLVVGDDIPLPDWKVSWDVIRQRSFKKRWHLPVLFPTKRFAIAATAVAVAFAIGILAGRSVFFPKPEQIPSITNRGYQGIASVSSYIETIEPLLIDFMNRSGQPESEKMVELTNRVITDMLTQTRLLKVAAMRNGNGNLYLLLDDIELMLISISNLGNQNGEVTSQLNHIIRNKSLLFRLRQLRSDKMNI